MDIVRQSEKLLSESGIDKALCISFFFAFSRFEYALKRVGYRTIDKKRKVSANWDAFANAHEDHWGEGLPPEARAAFQYFDQNPPKEQICVNGSLVWADRPGNQRLLDYLLMVRRVRNNFFHGGKYPPPNDAGTEPARNRDLLINSLQILDHCLKLDATVQSEFCHDFGP